MTRQAIDASAHFAELDYLASAWAEHAAQFNNDPACFNRYCDMQASAAREDGYAWIAERMLDKRVAL